MSAFAALIRRQSAIAKLLQAAELIRDAFPDVGPADREAYLDELAEMIGDHQAGASAGKPFPPAPRTGPGATTRDLCDATRRQPIARLLAERGPLRLKDIQAACGTCSGTIARYLRHPWFEKQGNHMSAWTLTAAGRAAVGISTPTGRPASPERPAGGDPGTRLP